jgi:hypothetical protein
MDFELVQRQLEIGKFVSPWRCNFDVQRGVLEAR